MWDEFACLGAQNSVSLLKLDTGGEERTDSGKVTVLVLSNAELVRTAEAIKCHRRNFTGKMLFCL
ncbi:MAG: hypothetical protein RMZ43_028790 [Nostoc sp. CmiVER01]|uniref:hypothetical protein n=1 Tax=Nostoc sp. CmiVER01 TaxID=3075384 RepID=UPI002AD23230|nr:hypothetical protein [Nostoc sp. CmiVER01]MDZ8123165.1 hypothetical protein [Nostoc sp. CmiVER01]